MADLESLEVLGTDLLLVSQVARKERVHRTTVLRWIEKGLPAVEANREQLGQMIAIDLLKSVPQHKVYLIRAEDLGLIPHLREYPDNTTRPRKAKKVGGNARERTRKKYGT